MIFFHWRSALIFAATLLSYFTPLHTHAATASRPNIIVILADDFGYGSLGSYGATGLKTPHLDRLAQEGRRFTQAYAPGSVCSPTRYGLMTGRYYWRSSIKDGEVLGPNAPLHIEPGRLTLASFCKSQNYRTAAVGKWHLGFQAGAPEVDWNQPLEPGPRAVGFDYFFGLGGNPGNGPHAYIEDENFVGRIPGEKIVIAGAEAKGTTKGIQTPRVVDRIMETITAKANAWIEANHAAPFFLYFTPNAVHGPIVPNPKFTGSPYGSYGDFIQELDWSVGQLLATLDRLKLAENTLVIFTSDNGGIVDAGNGNTGKAITAGLAINGALRGGKHTEWEGGFREPFIVRWPGHVPASTVSEQVICLTDLLATFAGVLQAPLPPGQAEDSFNILRAFTEPKPGAPVRDAVILQSADATYTLRQGDWKFIERSDAPTFATDRNKRTVDAAAHKKAAGLNADELYQLATDPAETTDIRAAHLERAAALKKLLVTARDRGFTRPDAGP
jgi:arylsulfatase A-like enzyme